MAAPRFGLTLPNRGVIIGATTVEEMLEMAQWADGAGWDSVWVGDSIFAKPRLDAMVLLGAIAARTTRVRIGPACFASTPLRNPLLLAYQWASLDFLSVRGKQKRAEVPSKRSSPISGSSPQAGCAGWRKRSRYCASPPRARTSTTT